MVTLSFVEFMLRTIVFILLMSLSMGVLAESYAYHPSTALYLGSGFDPFHPDRGLADCIKYEGDKSVDGSRAVSTRYSLALVKSRRDLFNQLNVSASLSARVLFFSANANADYFNEHRFHSDSVTWMVLGRSDYGRFAMRNPTLAPEAQELIDENKHEQFERMCGSEYVKLERRAVLIAAIFSVENVSEEEKSKLDTAFSASYSAAFFSVDTKAKYSKFFSAASTSNRITTSIYSIGGEGITKFAQLVVAPDDLEKIQLVISQYMNSLGPSYATPIEYVSGSMHAFGWNGKSSNDAFKRERVLGELFHRYQENQTIYRRISSILDQTHSTYLAFLSTDAFEQYRQLQKDYAKLLNGLLDAADRCYQHADQCHLPADDLPPVHWPDDLATSCERLRLTAYHLGLIKDAELAQLRLFNEVPIIQNPNAGILAYAMCGDLT